MSARRLACAAVVGLVAALSVASTGATPVLARPLGSGPLDDVVMASNTHARFDCGLTGPFLAAMMLSVVFHETGAVGALPPSPMTLSRFDVNDGLFAFGTPSTPFPRAYWNPGVGMWQFDPAGLGRPHAASYYMNTQTAAPVVAQQMATQFCRTRQMTNPDDATLRAAVWRPWNACNSGACEVVFTELFDYTTGQLRPQTRFEGVTRTGGMQARRCRIAGIGAVVDCHWVNPALAEGHGAGSTAWANPSVGRAPLSLPFYVYEFGGREYRNWLGVDTGYGGDINGSRLLTSDARNGGITWSSGPGVCDLTLGRGSCPPEPPLGPERPVVPNSLAIAGQGRGVGADGRSGPVVVVDRRVDGRLRISEARPPLWSGWQDLAGFASSDPDVVIDLDGAIHVFARGLDGSIWWWTPDRGWSSLGGTSTSAPAAVSSSPGRIDVFTRGSDGALWTGTLFDGVFFGWSSLGGIMLGDPEVTSWGAGRVDVFAVGADQALWHRGFESSTWFPWEHVGGTLTASPAAASASSGRIAVAVRGVNGAVYTMGWNGSSWMPWTSIGGITLAAPELAAGPSGSITMLVRGTDGDLYRAQGSHVEAWGPWARFP